MNIRSAKRPLINFLGTLTATCFACINLRQTAMATSQTTNPKILRLLSVQGFNDRQNDVIFCKSQNTAESRVIFFGGDSQDYPELMEAHRDNYRFTRWNLVNTAEILSNRFKKSDIYIIKPSKMHLKSFSCFSNFVESSIVGAPNHNSNYNAIVHLKMLISNASKMAARELGLSLGDVDTERDTQVPLILIGFSKGSVVLNQIVHELYLADSNSDIKYFLDLITDFYWLDGGNPGGSNTWITDIDLLKQLAALDANIYVYVTPYQINDEHRPWLRKEEKIFSDTLKRLNATVERKVFFENESRNILKHFELLEKF